MLSLPALLVLPELLVLLGREALLLQLSGVQALKSGFPPQKQGYYPPSSQDSNSYSYRHAMARGRYRE